MTEEQSELSSLPKGWVWTTLGEIISLEYGKGLRKDKRDSKGKIPVYGSNGIVGYHSTPLVKEPCLIVGRKGAAGAVHISKGPCWAIDTTYYVTAPKGITLVFLYYLLSSLNLKSLDKSTAIPGLNRNDAYAIRIRLPPFPEQNRIVDKLEGLFSKLDAGVKSLQNVMIGDVEKVVKQGLNQSERLRRSILKRALEGKLVPQDPSDEPANKILENIRKERELNNREKRTVRRKV